MRCLIRTIILLSLVLGATYAFAQDRSSDKSANPCDMRYYDSVNGENLEKAVGSLRERIKKNPSLTECRIRLGYLLLKKGSNEEALNEFDEVLRLMPTSHPAKTGKGIAYAHKGDLKSAEAAFKEALILNPDPVKAHYELGLVYERMGQLQKAIDEYREGISVYEKGRK